VSTHAIPLRLRSRVVGALSLFQATPERLGDDDIALAQALADVATIAILQQRTLEQSHVENSQLETALTSRVLIEQVKGVPAERWNTPVDDAFAAFRTYARARHLRLSELAAQIISGAFDSTVIPAAVPDWHDGRLGRPASRLRRCPVVPVLMRICSACVMLSARTASAIAVRAASGVACGGMTRREKWS